MSSRVRVFIASSVDGFIAGENNDLSWLPPPQPNGDDLGFSALLSEVGALLMGRATYDVVAAFDGEWPYGSRPVLVATHRSLSAKVSSVRAVSGSIDALVRDALSAADGRDVYLDGGALIRSALDAGLVDEMVVTQIPVILGRGHALFAGCASRHRLELVECTARSGGLVQCRYRLPR
jgi:dihydrofolate reductase